MDAEPATVAELGEFALIDVLAETLAAVGATSSTGDAAPLLGIGDDAAAWTPTPGARALITTDSLIGGVHFRLDWTSWRDLGHKALAVNLSDVAAMGGRPRLAVVTLGLTGAEPVAGLRELYRGLGLLARRYQTAIAGGDIVASPDRFGLHVTVVGESWPEAEGRLLTRDGARPGDLLAVSGPLGLSAAGLRLLLARESVPGAAQSLEPLPAGERAMLAAHHRPQPRIECGRLLVEAGATAAMDLSDGLWGDLAKICARSKVAARVVELALPAPESVRQRFPDSWLDLATRGGEDYELLFTIAPEAFAALTRQCQERDLPLPVAIGRIVPPDDNTAPIVLRRADGREEPVQGGAFDHFAHG
ncbi:MAG TPA: thiamine-phosphate kinase [Thermomicrobiales bacterium]|nr:thiamine-phosphate kinase [Thermomicrobiales bacterium]